MSTPPLTPLAAAALHAGSPERALEIGCGNGEATLFLAREFPRARVRGVDASAQAIRRASARVGLDPEGRVAFKVGTRGDLPFPDDQFDLVALVDLVPSPGEATRVLRPRRPPDPGPHAVERRLGRPGEAPAPLAPLPAPL